MSGKRKKKKDTPVKRQMQKPHIFCDFVNGVVFGGIQRLTPDMLKRLPEGTVLEMKERQDGASLTERRRQEVLQMERTRDVIFEASLPSGEKMVFRVILATENQSFVDYGMTIRNMVYDAGGYGEQLKIMQQKRKDEQSLKTGDEFLSGIRKDDRFVPILTFTFYYGEKAWDGCTNLYSLLDIPEDEQWIYEYISDYKLNLVHAENVEADNFHTGLRQVFELLPFSQNGVKIREYTQEHEDEFTNVTEETCELLLTFFDGRDMKLLKNKEKFRNENGGGYNMCTAFQQIRDEGIKIGEVRGEARGEKRGEKRGEARVNKLIQRLISDSRSSDIERAVTDSGYQKKLFKYYGI